MHESMSSCTESGLTVQKTEYSVNKMYYTCPTTVNQPPVVTVYLTCIMKVKRSCHAEWGEPVKGLVPYRKPNNNRTIVI